jgi:LCP family protein required for cell wall assembly
MNPVSDPVEASAVTQPTRPKSGLDSFQAIRTLPPEKPVRKAPGCLWLALLLLVPLVYFFAPVRANFLILGIDGGLGRGDLGRTDTIILATVSPLRPSVGMLSIPRDLWVPIEGVGENRINTAYFFAEAKQPGSGSIAALRAVSQNFDVPVNYYLVVRMDGLLSFVDAMGGVDIKLSKAAAGLPAGITHLDGKNALAFARSRANADDFSRMAQAQLLIKAVLQRLLQPEVWPALPQILSSAEAVIDTNIPVWQWPRLGLAFLRAGQGGIDSRVITREMVRPFTTNQGAQVLAPNWDAIGKVTSEMFGR